jgi:hypothetical protein
MSITAFRTTLPVSPGPLRIRHSQRWMLIGSCFTEHIGARLANAKFQTLVNPFGIVYNPVSMAACLARLAAGDRFFGQEELFLHNECWHSWEHHSRFSHPDATTALARINTAYRSAAGFLTQCDGLILTLGAAEVSILRETGKIVANNHKAPAAWFESRRLSVEEIVDALAEILLHLRQIRPELRIILSVSPVRHLRSGLVENQRSKAALLLACAEICEQIPGAHYFPAYELLMDDLRDYRFYSADMLHPSELAVDYIWAYFSEQYFDAPTRQLNEQIEKIRAAMQHRPFHPQTQQHQAFLQAQLRAIEAIKKEAPKLDFSAEEQHFVLQMTPP